MLTAHGAVPVTNPAHRRDSRVALAAAASYVGLVALGLGLFEPLHLSPRTLPEWVGVPGQLVAIVLCALAISRRLPDLAVPRATWALVLGYAALRTVATFVWNLWRPRGIGPVYSFADTLYLADYWVLTAGYWLMVRRIEGSLGARRLWLDVAAVTSALGAAFWAVLLVPELGVAPAPPLPAPFALAYAFTLIPLMATAAILCIRLTFERAHWAALLLVIAGLADASWELAWLAGWLTQTDFVGPYYDFGDVLCFTLISCAVVVEAPWPRRQESTSADRAAHLFLPILATLLAIALIAASLASTRAAAAWVLVGLVSMCAVLLFLRHATVRAELGALNRALISRSADARVMELVRQSPDLVLVTDAAGIISFASSASETLIGLPADALRGASFTGILGEAHAPNLAALIRACREEPNNPVSGELSWEHPGRGARLLVITAANRLANAHIGGLTFALSDVTERRTLELDVLNTAGRERLRLAADLHDGVGQDITGIAMLLHAARTSARSDPSRHDEQLEEIAGHLNQTVQSVRALAQGLSPLYVVGGSLADALMDLSDLVRAGPPVIVDCDDAVRAEAIEEGVADHLWRIAHEAVRNALKHSGCRHIHVTLRLGRDALEMTVADDGVGIPAGEPRRLSLGRRLMEYRARALGGALAIESDAASGTRVTVRVARARLSRADRAALEEPVAL